MVYLIEYILLQYPDNTVNSKIWTRSTPKPELIKSLDLMEAQRQSSDRSLTAADKCLQNM